MTMPIKFDTLEYARRLAEAGIPADQADAHAQALSEALATASVTPAELVLVKSELLARMDMLKTEVYARMDRLKVEIDARIDQLKVEIDARIDQLKVEIDARLDRFEALTNIRFKVLYWLTGLSLVMSALTFATQIYLLAKLLP
ncbi:hypothetical protein NHH73_00830 [Oxalobacteraceae bacterium OTU3CINTB1]|nr:hypothetical protein NHH73_00830 [Oxalobacteraceae bacterium OTU3CINTB1]